MVLMRYFFPKCTNNLPKCTSDLPKCIFIHLPKTRICISVYHFDYGQSFYKKENVTHYWHIASVVKYLSAMFF